MLKNTLETFLSCSMQKTALKTPYIRKIAAFPSWQKLATMQRLYPLQNCQFGSKFKILKTMLKNTLQTFLSCSVQKTAPKNS